MPINVEVPGYGLVEFEDENQARQYFQNKEKKDAAEAGFSVPEYRELHKKSQEAYERNKGIKKEKGFGDYAEDVVRGVAGQPFLRKATSGATLGLTEPVAAGISSLIRKGMGDDKSLGDIYKDVAGDQRTDLKRMEEEHPLQSMLGEIAGIVAPGGAYNRLLGAAGKAIKVPGLATESLPFLQKLALKGAQGGVANLGAGSIGKVSSGAIGEAKEWNPAMDFLLGMAGDVVGEVLGAAGNAAAKGTKNAATRIMNSFLKPSVKDLQQGKNLGAEILERTNWPRTMKGYSKIAQEGLQKNEEILQSAISNNNIPIDNEIVAKEIEKLKNVYDPIPGGMKPIGATDDLGKVEEALSHIRQSPETLAGDANILKRNISKQLKQNSFYNPDPSLATSTAILKNQRQGIQKAIENVVPEAKSINQELSVYKRLEEAVDKNLNSKGRSNIFNLMSLLSALGGGVGGAAFGGTGGGLIGLLAPMALGTPLGKSSSAQVLKYLASKMENLGNVSRYAAPIISRRLSNENN
ncbi:MAG: hypothetical protein BWY41_00046 [Candidatus Atribacteria bacterium ADurb.Bin276]|uniref:Uncharacterized protein n=1 Tax=Candidatus Atribacter allofermentans TaxID=1852833 RepID=A0A1V5T4D1_9BACT|nr:MAG: hypothetical protein BWY41_00046 [Candidatus Atribacteria bacterium ADurb.Bin276]